MVSMTVGARLDNEGSAEFPDYMSLLSPVRGCVDDRGRSAVAYLIGGADALRDVRNASSLARM